MEKLTSEEIIFIKNNINSIKKDGKVVNLEYIFESINKLHNEVLNFDNSNIFEKE